MNIFSRKKFRTIKKLKNKYRLEFSILDKERIKQLYFDLLGLKNFFAPMENRYTSSFCSLSHILFELNEVMEVLDFICTDSESIKDFTSLGK